MQCTDTCGNWHISSSTECSVQTRAETGTSAPQQNAVYRHVRKLAHQLLNRMQGKCSVQTRAETGISAPQQNAGQMQCTDTCGNWHISSSTDCRANAVYRHVRKLAHKLLNRMQGKCSVQTRAETGISAPQQNAGQMIIQRNYEVGRGYVKF
jgi:hypothetical protein